jgi:hypothetical protein
MGSGGETGTARTRTLTTWPVLVVDEAYEWLLGGCGRPEGDVHRVLLRTGYRGELVDHRTAQLVHCRERHLELRLDARDLHDSAVRSR